MATVMNVKESKEFCDEAYTELSDIRNKILELRDRSVGKAPARGVEGGLFSRHLADLANEIEWKLQILAHSCPYDWEGSKNYEDIAEVSSEEKSKEQGFSPGYLGG
jgi:hypothetical protein